jgi:hypothetical protein
VTGVPCGQARRFVMYRFKPDRAIGARVSSAGVRLKIDRFG